jgi:hypothetical protein
MAPLDLFLLMSEELCGISAYYLRGTDYAKTYLDTVLRVVGADSMERLLATYASLPTCCQQDREAGIRADLLSHDEFGPVARNVIKLWYSATWFELPQEWHQTYTVFADDRTFIPAAYAYPESFLGPAVGAHPAGAKPTGHQSWVFPPDYLPLAEARFPSKCDKAQ